MAIPTPLISQKTGDPLSRLLNQFRIFQVFVVKFPGDVMARIDSALGTIGLQPVKVSKSINAIHLTRLHDTTQTT